MMITIMVTIYAFIVLAAAIAVIMSLERVLGRPIPKLQNSPMVRRNRAFTVVPISMVTSFAFAFFTIFDLNIMTSSDTDPSAWQTPLAILYISILALAFSGAIGWIIFATLWVTSKGWRLGPLYFKLRHYQRGRCSL